VTGDDGNDTINSGSGNDTVDAGPGDDYKVMLGAGNDVAHGGDGNDGDASHRGIGIQGQDGDDLIYGDAGSDHVSGGAGNDQLYGGDGDDTMDGGDDNDYIDLGTGDDNVTGDEGDDTILPGDGSDKIYGEEGSNHIILTNDGAFDLVYCRQEVKNLGDGYVTYVGTRTPDPQDRLEGCGPAQFARTWRQALTRADLVHLATAIGTTLRLPLLPHS